VNIVFTSEAEIDAVQRLYRGGAQRTVEALPERGALAFRISLPALAGAIQRTAPKAARLLAQGLTLDGYVDLDQSGLRARASFEFDSLSTARRSAEAAQLLFEALSESSGLLGLAAKNAVLSQSDSRVVLRLTLTKQASERALGCSGALGSCP
jgi:hypothetical protein